MKIAFVRRSGTRISEFKWIPSFLAVLLHVGVERAMFSTDHPRSR
jgi:hypothetical protein